MTRQIPLTLGKVAIVDDEDYEELSKWKWYSTPDRNGKSYAIRGEWVDKQIVKIRMHRQIMSALDGQYVDHIDGDTLNNTRSNLRFATQVENMQNMKTPKSNTSGYKGVSFSRGRWVAHIRIDGKQVYLGSFVNKLDAANRYNEAALKEYGEFARINNLP